MRRPRQPAAPPPAAGPDDREEVIRALIRVAYHLARPAPGHSLSRALVGFGVSPADAETLSACLAAHPPPP